MKIYYPNITVIKVVKRAVKRARKGKLYTVRYIYCCFYGCCGGVGGLSGCGRSFLGRD